MAQTIIGIFDTSCPSGWVRVSDFDDKFLVGKATYDAVGGGNDTHTHTYDAPAVTTDEAVGVWVGSDSSLKWAAENEHTHDIDAENNITTDSGTSLPNYVDVVFCSYEETF